jgi:hypothetical protein
MGKCYAASYVACCSALYNITYQHFITRFLPHSEHCGALTQTHYPS